MEKNYNGVGVNCWFFEVEEKVRICMSLFPSISPQVLSSSHPLERETRERKKRESGNEFVFDVIRFH